MVSWIKPIVALTAVLSVPIMAQQEPIIYLRDIDNPRDVDTVNQNFRFQSDALDQVENRVSTLESDTSTSISPDDDITFTGDNTHNGTETYNSSVTVNGTIFSPQVVSSYVVFVGTDTPAETIINEVNVTSITDLSGGRYRVNLTTEYVDDGYRPFATHTQNNSAWCHPFNLFPNSFDIRCDDDNGGAVDVDRVIVNVFGELSP